MFDRFILEPGQLTLESIKYLLEHQIPCSTVCNFIGARLKTSHETVKKVLHDKKIVYGINTGFGSLANQTISPEFKRFTTESCSFSRLWHR